MVRETGKKVWSQPKMVILLRNSPDEAVLGHCKYSALIDGGLNTPGTALHQGCADQIDTNCTNCHSRGGKGS
jgi:hypothetical protein